MALAKGISEEKQAIYLAAIEKAIANPEYLAKEAANKNNMLFMKGDAIQEKIDSTREYVESVKFWENDN